MKRFINMLILISLAVICVGCMHNDTEEVSEYEWDEQSDLYVMLETKNSIIEDIIEHSDSSDEIIEYHEEAEKLEEYDTFYSNEELDGIEVSSIDFSDDSYMVAEAIIKNRERVLSALYKETERLGVDTMKWFVDTGESSKQRGYYRIHLKNEQYKLTLLVGEEGIYGKVESN